MNVGRSLVAVLIIAGAAGLVVTGAAFYTHMLYLGALILIASWLWVTVLGRSIDLTRTPEFWRASVGDIFKEQYEVRNRSRFRAGWVELYNKMPLPSAAGSRLITRLNARENQSYVARTWLTQRGGYAVGPTLLTISDPLGLFKIRRNFPAARHLIVLPMTFAITSFLSPPGFLPGGKVIRRKAVEITPHAAGVRPYVPGDPMRRIHWPTTARRGQLIVKEFEQDPQAEVWIFLDAQKKAQWHRDYETPSMPLETLLFTRKPKITLPPDSLEYGISIAASLARYFTAERRAVGFVMQDQAYTMIAAERTDRQENKIMENLAFTEGRGERSIAELATAHAPLLPKGSTVILITATTSNEILVAADDLQRRKLRPVVILLDAESFGGPIGTEGIVRRLQDARIPVRLIRCGANLSESLAGFAGADSVQDVSTWQLPTLSHLT